MLWLEFNKPKRRLVPETTISYSLQPFLKCRRQESPNTWPKETEALRTRMGKKSLLRPHFFIAFRHIYEVLIYLFVCLFIYFPWYRKRNNNADKTSDRSSGANFASRGKLTDRVCGDCHQSPESFGAGGQRWERRCQAPWRRYSTSSTCWPQTNGMWLGTGRERHMPSLSQFPFYDHKPGSGCNKYVRKIRFIIYGFVTKEKLNCFEKCQLITSFRNQSSPCRIRM